MKRILLAIAVCTSLAASTAASRQTDELTIWIASDKAYQGLSEIGQHYQEVTGVKLTVEHDYNVSANFRNAAAQGEGPDIIIWAHDMFAGWVASGLLAPITPSETKRNELTEFTWNAVTIDGQIYGYPLTIETVSLLYNKDLITKPPETWEEIPALDRELQRKNKRAILWDFNDTYYSWGLLAANGGYVYSKKDGEYDLTDTGINNAGAQLGATMLKLLIDGHHMPQYVSYGQMEQAFLDGDVAMIINGPWSWSNYKSLNYGVAKLPTLNGHPSRPFVGVLAAGINAQSPNKAQAIDFIENYMLTISGLTDLSYDKMLGAVSHKEFQSVIAHDPRIRATMKNAMNGTLMPPLPNMLDFWNILEDALKAITSGQETIQTALDNAAEELVSTAQ